MHKLMCTFMTPMKKKIPDRNLDTSCPAGIPCNDQLPVGLIAPLVEHCTGIAEVMGSKPVQA